MSFLITDIRFILQSVVISHNIMDIRLILKSVVISHNARHTNPCSRNRPDADGNALPDFGICLICLLLLIIGFCFCLNAESAIFSIFYFTRKEFVMTFRRFSIISCIFAALFLLPGISAAGALPDTGQTKCYNDTAEITCPAPGEDFYGQDAQYVTNPRSYTKLDASGNDLPDTATSWTMVRDNVTGLIWEVKTDDGSVHDRDNEYTWYDSNPETNGGNAGTPGDGTDTEDFISALNSENFGGHSDWRLPTIKEMASISSMGTYDPAIDAEYFPNTQSSSYWSATSNPYDTSCAWCVTFHNGEDSKNHYKLGSRYVRGVRSGQAEASDPLVINGDGTVTDPNTGLMWQQQGPDSEMGWKEALGYCEGLSLAGYDDWRLPSREELRSIVDYGTYRPAIDTEYFLNTQLSGYWSAATYYAQNTDDAWCVDFYYGIGHERPKSDSRSVRGVRSGQAGSFDDLVISVTPEAGGTVAGTGISCPGDCDESYDFGTAVQLTATSADCYDFTNWSGDCSGTSPTCTLTMDADKSATANFAIKTFTVTISKAGNGTGTLSESTQTVNCGDNLTITATPDATSDFAGWTGDASGTGDAVLTNITSDKTLTATFTLRDLPTLVTNTDSVTVPEGGTSAFSVKLSAQPVSTTTVTVAWFSGDTDISVQSGATLTFTTSDWNTYKTVTLAATEDPDTGSGEASVQISASGLSPKLVTAAEQDNDELEIETDPAAVTVLEGETAAFCVKLSAQPDSVVTVTSARSDGDTDIRVQSGSILSFTPSNWNTCQTVTLKAAEDGDITNGQATIQVSASALDTKLVTATEQDRDDLAIVTETASLTVPEGGTAGFGIRLSAPPGQTVTVTTTRSGGDTDISVWSGTSLSFTDSDWDTYKTVTLAAAEDTDITDGQAEIQVSASGLDPKTVTATEEDKDMLALVTETGWVTVPEGNTAGFGVKLSAPPGRTVTVTTGRFSGDTDISVWSGATLSFTDSDWDTYKTVTLAAAEDADITDGEAAIQITASGLDSKLITAAEEDTDLLTLVTDTASVTVPEGETAAFGVRLSAPPGRAVTVTVTRFSGDTDISVRSGAELSFTDSAWDTYKSVTLTAAADADTEEGKAVIQISASGLDSASVTATEQEPPVNIAAPGLIPREDTADTTPTLEWNPVPGATNYRIQISSQSSFATTLAETETAALSHTPSEALPPGGIYWRVSSDLDYAYFSAYDHFFVTAATLNPPANPQAVSGVSSVRLTWEPVTGTDIAGYNVYRSSSPDGSYTRISTDPVTGDTYTDDTVPAGDAAYYYYLTATDADGSESTPSDVVSAVPGQVRLFIPDARGEVGTQIRLPVNIANADGLRMCSADIYVTYNPNVLSATDIERTPLSSAYSWGTALEMPGIVRAILVGSDEARERLYGEGSLFYLIFDVRGNSGDTTPLEFQSSGTFFYDCDDSYETKEVGLDLSDIGIFRVDGNHILGDSNGDGKVNSADVFTTLNIAVGNLELTEKRKSAGDVSGDGRIRSNDAAMTVRLALGQSLVPESSSQRPGASGLSVPDNTVIPAAGSVWVPIDTDDASAVMGADIILSYDPLVVTAAGVRLGPVTENFGIQVNREQPGQIRISFSALAGDGLSGGTGALIEAEFTARTDISEKRTSPLTLTTVRLNDTYGRDFATSALQAEVRTSSGSLTVGDGYGLRDVIAALKVLAGTDEGGVSSDADISGDGKMGMEEVIRILQIVAD